MNTAFVPKGRSGCAGGCRLVNKSHPPRSPFPRKGEDKNGSD